MKRILILSFIFSLSGYAQTQKQVKKPMTKPAVKPATKPMARPMQQKAAPVTKPTSDEMPAASSPAPVQVPLRSSSRMPAPVKTQSFFYGNLFYTSYADEVLAKVQGVKSKARTIFSGFGLGLDYTRYAGRYLYGWNLNMLQGSVDIARTNNVSYPRKDFLGVFSGPEVGYRVNPDMDLSYGLGALYRDIQAVGQSVVVYNQLNVKVRFTPRLTLFQNFGNYGKVKSYSYSIGLRWLL